MTSTSMKQNVYHEHVHNEHERVVLNQTLYQSTIVSL